MIQINASPELCYVLWCARAAFEFFLFAVWVLLLQNAVVRRRGILWYVMCVFFIVVVLCNITYIMGKISAWYNILAQLKGW